MQARVPDRPFDASGKSYRIRALPNILKSLPVRYKTVKHVTIYNGPETAVLLRYIGGERKQQC